MKKIIAFVFIFLLLPFSSFAQEKSYEIPEIGINLSIPQEHIVLTRESKTTDPEIQGLNLNLDETIEHFKTSGIFLNALDKNQTYEMVVIMFEDPGLKLVDNFNTFKKEDFDQVFKTAQQEANNADFKYKSYEIKQQGDVSYMVMETEPRDQEGLKITSLQYYTVIDSKAYNFTLHALNHELTPEMKDTLAKIVSTVNFTGTGTGTTSNDEDTQAESSDDNKQTKSSVFSSSSSLFLYGGIALGVILLAGIVIFLLEKKKDPEVF